MNEHQGKEQFRFTKIMYKSSKRYFNCKPKPFNLKMFQILATQATLAVPKYPMRRSYVTQSHCNTSDQYISNTTLVDAWTSIIIGLYMHHCTIINASIFHMNMSSLSKSLWDWGFGPAALSVVANANPFSMEKARACTFQVSRFGNLPSKVKELNSANLCMFHDEKNNQRHPTTPMHFLWTRSELE